jgi:hypothetical protein
MATEKLVDAMRLENELESDFMIGDEMAEDPLLLSTGTNWGRKNPSSVKRSTDCFLCIIKSAGQLCKNVSSGAFCDKEGYGYLLCLYILTGSEDRSRTGSDSCLSCDFMQA